MTQARRILLRAAEILERDGWCQEKIRDPRGHWCASGAISQATSEVIATRLLLDHYCGWLAASRLLAEHVNSSVSGVISWNDTAGRTAEEVISAIRKAAA